MWSAQSQKGVVAPVVVFSFIDNKAVDTEKKKENQVRLWN